MINGGTINDFIGAKTAAAGAVARLKPLSGSGINANQAVGASTAGVKSFGEILAEAALRDGGLTFSAHAQKRMSSRGIRLTASDASRLGAAREKLAAKGSKEALVILDDKAFLVSVKNGTVITALDKSELKQTVFTNIDGAVIA